MSAAPVDRAKGDALFARLCSPCHGKGGAGQRGGAAAGRRRQSGDARGQPHLRHAQRRRGRHGDGIVPPPRRRVAALRSSRRCARCRRSRPSAPAGRRSTGDAQRGAAELRALLRHAATALAARAQTGPALANPAFQASATDGYLTATILRGRGATAMPHFGTAATDHPQLDAGSGRRHHRLRSHAGAEVVARQLG